MAGVRIHDYTHAHWKQDVDILVGGAGDVLAYITIPKPTAVAQVAEMIAYIQAAAKHGIKREIPIHVLIETHGALRDAYEIAALPCVQVLDFGLMDFVSGHHGAIPVVGDALARPVRAPLIARAKAEVVAAALPTACARAQRTLDLKNTYHAYRDARRARNEFGFLRMWSIYPAQIQPIVDAMKPDYAEVAGRRRDPARRAEGRTGARSSTRASCTTARPTATSGNCCRRRKSPASRFPTQPQRRS